MFHHLFKLRVRLILLALIGAIPALALIGYISLQQRQLASEDAQESALAIAQQIASQQERSIESTRALLTLLARVPQVRNYTAADCQDFLTNLLAQSSQYTNLGVIAPNGTVVCSALPMQAPVDVSDRIYFQRAQKTRNFAIGRYQIGRITEKPAINMAYPLSGRGAPAVVYAALDLTGLSRVFADARLPPASAVTAVDRDNIVLARFPDRGNPVGERAAVAPQLRELLGEAEVGTFRLTAEGSDRLYAVTRLFDRVSGDMLLYVSTPAALAFADSSRALWQNLAILGLVSLLLIAGAWVSGNLFVVRGINALLGATRRLASGDLSARSGLGHRYGEVGELGQAFDDMAAALQRHGGETARHQERIDRLNRVYAVLSAINSTIIRIKDRDTLYTAACRIAVEQGGFALAWVGEVQPAELTIARVWRAGGEADTLQLIPTEGETITDRRSAVLAVLRENRAIVYNDVGKYPRAEPWQNDALELGYRSCMFLPLQLDGRTVACLGLFADELGFFDAEEVELLRELAADISLGLDYLDKGERLNYLAYYDGLTGLPNLSLFRDRLRQVTVTSRSHRRVAVLMIAIDGLRNINNTHGHHVGDLLLRETAARLRRCLREGDTVARLHNDEFGVLLTELEDVDDIARVTRKILRSFEAPAMLAEAEVFMTVRIGITVHPDDGRDPDLLIKNAGAALACLRGGGELYKFFTPQLHQQAERRLQVERELRRALERQELHLLYQPVIDLAANRMVAVEALLRWRSETLGEISPAEFIPIAEDSGLINPIGDWVLQQACHQARQWHGAGAVPVKIAVNLSVVQLRHGGFVERVEAILAEAGFMDEREPPISLEITESKLMETAERSTEILDRLRARGITIAIDDFGTGYSNLNYLKRLPVHTLKIDLSFIRNITHDPSDASIVQAIIALGHHLDRQVVAEGVETEQQLELLRRFGCDSVQGYHYSRPVAAEEIERLQREVWPG
jgi:diguanylate cyclase (GGDEF)-like protein